MWIRWAGGNDVKTRVWGEYSFSRRNHHTVWVDDLEAARQMLSEPRSPFLGSRDEFVVSDIDAMRKVGATAEQTALLVVEMGIMEVEQLAAVKRGDVKKVAHLLNEAEEVVKVWVGNAKAFLTAERVEVPGVIEEIETG